MTHPFLMIVFDFDGTLVDSLQFIVNAASRAFEDQGFPAPEPAAIQRIVGLRLEVAVARLLPDPDDMATAERITAAYEGYHVVAGSDEVEAEWPRVNGW